MQKFIFKLRLSLDEAGRFIFKLRRSLDEVGRFIFKLRRSLDEVRQHQDTVQNYRYEA